MLVLQCVYRYIYRHIAVVLVEGKVLVARAADQLDLSLEEKTHINI